MARKRTEFVAEGRLTVAEFARLEGLTPRAVTAWVERGVVELDAEKRLDAVAARAAIAGARVGTPGPGRGRRQPDDGSSASGPQASATTKTLVHWKTLETREMYRKRKLERLELQNALVRRDAVENEHATLAAIVRDQLRQIGPRLGPALAAESDARKCRDMVVAAIDKALSDLGSC